LNGLPASYGPFWRSDLPATVEAIVKTGEVWGQAPRNFFNSSIPKVKAYLGHIPAGTTDVEFYTNVPPDPHGIPGRPTWSGRINEDWHKISVVVTKVVK